MNDESQTQTNRERLGYILLVSGAIGIFLLIGLVTALIAGNEIVVGIFGQVPEEVQRGILFFLLLLSPLAFVEGTNILEGGHDA